jgi:antibiotic biosynthesis monooxygenase (ABM) superfamily enzyme
MTMSSSEPVTVLFSRTAKAGKEKEYEAWNQELIRLSEQQPGHVATSVVADGDGRYFTLQQFESHAALQAWLASESRHQRLSHLNELTIDSPEPAEMTGMESWFRLPGHTGTGHIPRWKMAVVTFLIVYCFVLLMNLTISPHIVGLPLYIRGAIFPIISVPLMTYIILPRATKVFRRWLYSKNN